MGKVAIPFPQLSASVGTTVGMAARTPRPVVSDTTLPTQGKITSSHTSTPLTTEGQVGQMSGIVQQIGQQLIVIITALLQYSFLSLFLLMQV